VAVCGACFVAALIGLMFAAKYWLAKKFPSLDRLTQDKEYLPFLAVCLTYQLIILPTIVGMLLYTSDVSRIDWWLGTVDIHNGVTPIVAVLCAQGAYNIKDFWFEHAIAAGDVAMWAHHFVSLALLAAPLFGLVSNAGATAMGVAALEVGSTMWNVLCVAMALRWYNALSVIRPLFLFTMLSSNVATLIILGAAWGVPDHRRTYGIGEYVVTFAILQLILVRMDNAIKIEERLARKIFGDCFCPARVAHPEFSGDGEKPPLVSEGESRAASLTGSSRTRFAVVGAMCVAILVLSSQVTELWLTAIGLFSEA